ncbi:MAG: hypothetical protein AAF501_01425 [Pseudomonadota bacterium]
MVGEVILHVGFPKTGTTTLQRAWSKDAGSFTYLGKAFRRRGSSGRFAEEWISEFRDLVNFGHAANVARATQRMQDEVLRSIEQAPNSRILISVEGFTNPFVDYKYMQPKDIFAKADHLAVLLAGLSNRGVRVQFVMTLRDQKALLPSLYSQIYYYGTATTLFKRDYDSFLDFLFDDPVCGFGPMFEFDAVHDRYAGHFGQRNVHMFEMDQILSGFATEAISSLAHLVNMTAQDMLDAIGNTRLNQRKVGTGREARYKAMLKAPSIERARRRTGMTFDTAAFGFSDRMRRRFGRDIYLTVPDRSDRIETYYAASNQRLSASHGIVFGAGQRGKDTP